MSYGHIQSYYVNGTCSHSALRLKVRNEIAHSIFYFLFPISYSWIWNLKGLLKSIARFFGRILFSTEEYREKLRSKNNTQEITRIIHFLKTTRWSTLAYKLVKLNYVLSSLPYKLVHNSYLLSREKGQIYIMYISYIMSKAYAASIFRP